MPDQPTSPQANVLYVLYFSTGFVIFQSAEMRRIKSQNPARHARNCPPDAYGFQYYSGPPRAIRISELTALSGMHFVDAIVIPTARLAEYCQRTGAYHNVDELMRNGAGATHHAHTRHGRFFTYDPAKDATVSTQKAVEPELVGVAR